MAKIIVYHGSPDPNIRKIEDNSCVTIFPHVAFIWGLNYSNEHPKYYLDDDDVDKSSIKKKYPYGRPWFDYDLHGSYFEKTDRELIVRYEDGGKPYNYGPKIKFKKGHEPDLEGVVYKFETTYDNIIFGKNYPFEMKIKKGTYVQKIDREETNELIKLSEKLFIAFQKYYLPLQQ